MRKQGSNQQRSSNNPSAWPNRWLPWQQIKITGKVRPERLSDNEEEYFHTQRGVMTSFIRWSLDRCSENCMVLCLAQGRLGSAPETSPALSFTFFHEWNSLVQTRAQKSEHLQEDLEKLCQ